MSLSKRWRAVSRPLRNLFDRRPLLANCVSYGALCGAAELTQQVLEGRWRSTEAEKLRSFDANAIGQYIFFGSAVTAPVLFVWYRGLDRLLPGVSTSVVAKKVFLDATLLAGAYYTAFFVGMAYMEGKRENLLQEWREKFVPTYIIGCVFWLPAQAFNFRFLPSQYRVVYVAFCTYVEVNILAVMRRVDVKRWTRAWTGNASSKDET